MRCHETLHPFARIGKKPFFYSTFAFVTTNHIIAFSSAWAKHTPMDQWRTALSGLGPPITSAPHERAGVWPRPAHWANNEWPNTHHLAQWGPDLSRPLFSARPAVDGSATEQEPATVLLPPAPVCKAHDQNARPKQFYTAPIIWAKSLGNEHHSPLCATNYHALAFGRG